MFLGDYIGSPVGDFDPEAHARGQVPGQASAPGQIPPELDIDSLFGHRVISRLRDAPNWRALVSWFADGLQIAENTMHDLRVRLAMPYAHGTQLDREGDGLGQPRNGLDDDTYRTVLAVRWSALFRRRTMQMTYDLLGTLASGTATTFEHNEHPPAAYEVVVYDITAETALLWFGLLLTGAPEGVGFYFLVVEDTATAFRYDVGPGYDDLDSHYAYHLAG